MKAFEEIFNRRIERIIKLSLSMDNPGGMSKKEIAKLTWRAALEWALDDDNDLSQRIREELEEE